MSVTVNSTSFCIDALLARDDPVRSPAASPLSSTSTPSDLESSSPQPVSSSSSPSFPAHFFPPSSLYAAMYSGHHHHPVHSQSVVSSSGSLMHGSAFHPPLQDMKSHAASGNLSMDWLARAGLLFHRTSGKNTKKCFPLK